jgi:hypothetical protein
MAFISQMGVGLRSHRPYHWTAKCLSLFIGELKKMPLGKSRGHFDYRWGSAVLINRYIPMASSIKSILNLVVVVCVCAWLLQVTGLWGSITKYRLTR